MLYFVSARKEKPEERERKTTTVTKEEEGRENTDRKRGEAKGYEGPETLQKIETNSRRRKSAGKNSRQRDGER